MAENTVYSDIFDEIKERVSLVAEIESRGIFLAPSGRQRLRCRCPLPGHNDGTPSFHVSLNDDPELFYCFGCKRGGSVIDFVMYCGEDGKREFQRKDAIKYIIKKYKLENLTTFDIDRISSIPNKYKREELPIFSKTLMMSEDIRSYLKESINIKSDFKNISDYMKNIDEAMSSSDYTNLSVLEDLVYNALKLSRKNDNPSQLKNKCKTCSACELRAHCNNSVFGFGNFNSDVFLIGDFITFEESSNNRPFSDNAGLFLIEEIQKIGIDPFDLWLTTCQSCCSVKGNLDFARICANEHLFQHVLSVKPKKVVVSGDISKTILSDMKINILNITDYRKVYDSGGVDSSLYAEFTKEITETIGKKILT